MSKNEEDLSLMIKLHKKMDSIKLRIGKKTKVKAEFLSSDFNKLLEMDNDFFDCYLTFDRNGKLNNFVEIFDSNVEEEVVAVFDFFNKKSVKLVKKIIKNYYNFNIPFLVVQMFLIDKNKKYYNNSDDNYIKVELEISISDHTHNITNNRQQELIQALTFDKDIKKNYNLRRKVRSLFDYNDLNISSMWEILDTQKNPNFFNIYYDDDVFLNIYYNDYNDYIEGKRNSEDQTEQKEKINIQMFSENKEDFINYIKVYDVGNANFSIGYNSNDEKVVVFDLGFRSSRKKDEIIDEFSTIDSNGYVVISHFDYDHINGYIHLEDEAFNRDWYLPYDSPKINSTITEQKLFKKIPIYKRNVLKDGISKKILNVNIFKGEWSSKESNQSNKRNSNGLISVIDNNRNCLIPGDSLYLNFPQKYDIKEIDTIIIPHHCCNYNYKTKPDIINFNNITQAFVPTNGGRKKYKHPNVTHLNMFNKESLIRFQYTNAGENCNFIFKDNYKSEIDNVTKSIDEHFILFNLK